MAFPSLIKPSLNLQNEEEFKVTALFPKDADLAPLYDAAQIAINTKWGSKPPQGLKLPFKEGNEQGKTNSNGEFRVYQGFEDTITVNFKKKVKTKAGKENEPPQVVMANPNVKAEEKDAYAGRWAKAIVTAYAYDAAGNKGVTFFLNHVQILDHDSPLGNPSDVTLFNNEENPNQPSVKGFLDLGDGQIPF